MPWLYWNGSGLVPHFDAREALVNTATRTNQNGRLHYSFGAEWRRAGLLEPVRHTYPLDKSDFDYDIFRSKPKPRSASVLQTGVVW